METWTPLRLDVPIIWDDVDTNDNPELFIRIDLLYDIATNNHTVPGRALIAVEVYEHGKWKEIGHAIAKGIVGKITKGPYYHAIDLSPLRATGLRRLRATWAKVRAAHATLAVNLRCFDHATAAFYWIAPITESEVAIEDDEKMKGFVCGCAYRQYNPASGDFDYGDASGRICPYSGDGYFDRYGIAVRQKNDDCGKTVADCRLRFPKGTLPFWPVGK